MITAASLKDHVKHLFAGIVESIGEVSPKIALVALPDGKAAIALVRSGFEWKQVTGPAKAKRVHVIEDAASFAEWLKRHGGNEKVVEILIDNDKAIASLDPRDVDACVVSMPLSYHPRFERWLDLLTVDKNHVDIGQLALQRHVLSCLEDFRVVLVDGDEDGINEGQMLAGNLQRFNAIRTSEIKVEIDDLGYVKFAAVSGKVEVTGKLPPKFKIVVPMFLDVRNELDGEYTYELELFLGVEPQEKGPPIFSLTCPKLEVVRREARTDLVAHLRRLLGGTEFLVGLGKLATATYTGKVQS